MNSGCRKCDKNFILNGDRCPKHRLEYKKWVAEQAQDDYMEELRMYSRKKETK